MVVLTGCTLADPTGKSSLDNRGSRRLEFFQKNVLHFLKTLLEETRSVFWSGLVFANFDQVPLGRFYSSRPSSRSRSEIVSE